MALGLHIVLILYVVFTASRAKLSAATSIAKLRGQAKNNLYPQPEGTLGEHMQKHGTDLSDTLYGKNMVVNLRIIVIH